MAYTAKFQRLADEAVSNVQGVDPVTVDALINDVAIALDIRDPDEHEAGHIDGSLNISHGKLEMLVEEQIPISSPSCCAAATPSIAAHSQRPRSRPWDVAMRHTSTAGATPTASSRNDDVGSTWCRPEVSAPPAENARPREQPATTAGTTPDQNTTVAVDLSDRALAW